MANKYTMSVNNPVKLWQVILEREVVNKLKNCTVSWDAEIAHGAIQFKFYITTYVAGEFVQLVAHSKWFDPDKQETVDRFTQDMASVHMFIIRRLGSYCFEVRDDG